MQACLCTHVCRFSIGVRLPMYVRTEFERVPLLARACVRVRVCIYVCRQSKTYVSAECSRVTTLSRACLHVCVCKHLSDLCIYVLIIEHRRCESSGLRTYMPKCEAVCKIIKQHLKLVLTLAKDTSPPNDYGL